MRTQQTRQSACLKTFLSPGSSPSHFSPVAVINEITSYERRDDRQSITSCFSLAAFCHGDERQMRGERNAEQVEAHRSQVEF